jgi:hypothetical protein
MLPVRYDDETLRQYQQRVGEDVYPSHCKMKPPKVKREPEVVEPEPEPEAEPEEVLEEPVVE